MKAILIDDEAGAREVLQNLILRFIPEVEVLAEANGLANGSALIKELKPDIVFCDIQMPKYAGYEIVDFFEKIDFHIIFVTAYDQYAIKAFELSAIDYLLKPVEVSRLKLAVEKVMVSKKTQIIRDEYETLKNTIHSKTANRLTVLDKGYRTFLNFENIIAVEGQSAYCKIYMDDGSSKVISKNLKQTYLFFEGHSNFIRCHKSWVVNLNFLESYSKLNLEIKLKNELTAKLSKQKIADFEQLVNQS